MSSVTRFLKQVPAGLNYYSLPTAYTSLYEFVPSSSNTVGNYPPGAMVAAANSAALAAYLQTTGMPYAGGSLQAGFVMRDMGKTVKASIASSEANAAAGTVSANTEAHFRQFQILKPVAGNVDGAFGVSGAATIPNAYTDYVTVYIPVTILGTVAAPAGVALVPGGQM
jgi:hypothetical protein